MSGTVQRRKPTLAPQSSLLCELYMLHFLSSKGKDSKKSKTHRTTGHPSPQGAKTQSDGSALQGPQQNQEGLKKANMMALCFPWTDLPRWWEAQRKEQINLSNVNK